MPAQTSKPPPPKMSRSRTFEGHYGFHVPSRCENDDNQFVNWILIHKKKNLCPVVLAPGNMLCTEVLTLSLCNVNHGLFGIQADNCKHKPWVVWNTGRHHQADYTWSAVILSQWLWRVPKPVGGCVRSVTSIWERNLTIITWYRILRTTLAGLVTSHECCWIAAITVKQLWSGYSGPLRPEPETGGLPVVRLEDAQSTILSRVHVYDASRN